MDGTSNLMLSKKQSRIFSGSNMLEFFLDSLCEHIATIENRCSNGMGIISPGRGARRNEIISFINFIISFVALCKSSIIMISEYIGPLRNWPDRLLRLVYRSSMGVESVNRIYDIFKFSKCLT